jgi:hypothetical protein
MTNKACIQADAAHRRCVLAVVLYALLYKPEDGSSMPETQMPAGSPTRHLHRQDPADSFTTDTQSRHPDKR